MVREALDNEDTPDARDDVATIWAEELVSMVINDSLPRHIVNAIRPDVDLEAESLSYLRTHMRVLVDTLCGPEIESSPAHPTAFADELKVWGLIAFGGWLDILINSFQDGMTSVNMLVRNVLEQKLMVAGPEFGFLAQMASGMLSGVLQKIHVTYRQHLASMPGLDEHKLAEEKWVAHVPAAERSHWCQTIARDMTRQLEESRQPRVPLSASYTHGQAPKRRKLSHGQPPQNASEVLIQTLTSAIQQTEQNETDPVKMDAVLDAMDQTDLPSQFKDQLRRDVDENKMD
eukprot:TRINITY_DN4604_c0_g1_i1.p1 TRINITY_DN4604_c0_g1~~TRINITY_DN4604_c0_g1_i1.p1  ORF type:complete len:288 (+),score=103.58 TRINITY_DN4604_c0_g1_i1:51-914(+)